MRDFWFDEFKVNMILDYYCVYYIPKES
jgi:hypothetical protein